MISRLTRIICKSEKEYMQKCKAYMCQNGIRVLKILSDWNFQDYVVNKRDLALVSEKDFPINPRIKEADKLKQLISFLDEVGVKLEYNRDGTVSFYEADAYSKVINNHLKFTGARILEGLANVCLLSNGRITYDSLERILGKHYPKAPYLHVEDRRWHMIFFFKHVGTLCNFDETEIYFP